MCCDENRNSFEAARAEQYLERAENECKHGGDPAKAQAFGLMALAAAVLTLAYEHGTVGISITNAINEVGASIDNLEVNR